MKLKSAFSALLAVSLVAGCVNNQASVPLSTLGPESVVSVKRESNFDSRKVPSGILCEKLIDRIANNISGCEGYLTRSGPSTLEAEEIASINLRFAAEVSPVINFEFDKADLTLAAQAILDDQAAWMQRFVNLRFSVYGHTDLVGSEGYNLDLAKRRAEGVVAYLAGKGVTPGQLEALQIYGEAKPIVAADRREALNRRTVTEVTNYSTMPILRAKVSVLCNMIQPVYVASYPSCLNESKLAKPNLLSLPVGPIEVSNVAAKNTTNETGTSVSISHTADGKITDLNAHAGGGNTSVSLESTETVNTISREFKNNGEVTMTTIQDATTGEVLSVDFP
jgi:outer membrane protein OmpA-like peptidoglycan-associated protein